MLGDNRIEALFEFEHVADADFDVAGGTLSASKDLMDHDVGVWQGVSLSPGAATEEHGTHAGGLTDAVSVCVASEKLHGVVNREAGGDAAAGRVDIEVNVLFGIGHL